MPVDDLGDYDVQPVEGNPFGSMASSPNDYDVQPVDHDPFQAQGFSGHVAAAPDPNQPMTAKYIAARSQESASPYTPPLFERAGNYVANTAESYGVPQTGADRLGGATTTGLEAASYAPIVGAPLTAAEGVDAYNRGDTASAAASGLGTLASFFGPWAKTADLGAMKLAQRMAKKGAPAEDIIGKTGWFQGPEGLWKFERPDEGASFTGQGNFSRNLTLGDVYQNPEQYAAYPNLAKSPVEMLDPEFADRMHMLGGFQVSKTPRVGPPGKFLFRHDMPEGSTIPIHETQHAIQDVEGFAPGGSNLNPMQVLDTKSAQPFFHKQLDRAIAPRSFNEALRAGEPINRGEHEEIEQLKGLVRAGHEDIPGGIAENAAWQAGADWYQHQAGEAEARNAAFRAGNPLIAKAFHPWETSDIPWDELMLPPYRESGGRVAMNEDLRRRLALISQPRSGFADGGAPDDPDAAGFAALDKMTGRTDRAAEPDPAPAPVTVNDSPIDSETGLPSFDPGTYTPREPQAPVSGGRWGRGAELAYEDVAGKIGSAMDWAGDKFEQGIGGAAAAVGVPGARAFARDARGMLESGELGFRGAHEPIAREPIAAAEPELRMARKPPVSQTTVFSPYGVSTDAPFTRTGDVGGPLPGKLANKPVQGQLPGFNDPNYPEGRIATSIPTNKAIADVSHDNANRKIGIGLARADPDSYAKNAGLIQDYGLPLPPNATAEQAHQAFIAHATQNLLAVHDAYEKAIPGVTKTSKLWYDGGNNIVNAWADRYNRRPENVAGAIAALSPKRDWDINVGDAQRLANVERMGNILTRGGNFGVSDDMRTWIRGYVRGMADPDDRRAANAIFSDMQGKTLKDMSSTQKAWFVRAYDESHGPMLGNVPVDAAGNEVPNGYHLWNPDGTMGPLALNKAGTAPKQLTWASMDQLRKGIEAFEAEDMKPISTNMGQMHKVRNFYNNLVAPNSQQGDVTVDTHAIAAAHLMPLGLKDPEVLHGLGKGAGASGSGVTGAKGLYGAIAEAYRQAAAQRNLLPRQMQSITWEAIRSLWNPAQKTSLKDQVKNWWQQFKQGTMTRAQVYKNIFQKGFALPRWMTGDARQSDEEPD